MSEHRTNLFWRGYEMWCLSCMIFRIDNFRLETCGYITNRFITDRVVLFSVVLPFSYLNSLENAKSKLSQWNTLNSHNRLCQIFIRIFLIFSIQGFLFIIFSPSHCYFHNVTSISNWKVKKKCSVWMVIYWKKAQSKPH